MDRMFVPTGNVYDDDAVDDAEEVVAAEYDIAASILSGDDEDTSTLLLQGNVRSSNDIDHALLRKERSSRLSQSSVYDPLHPQNSKYLTAFLLVNSMIGSGILNQPYVFLESGIVGGLAGFALASVLTWTCVNMLTDVGLQTKVYEYQGIARLAFGQLGETVLDGCIAFLCFGALLGYIIVVGNTTSDLLRSWGCESDVCGVDAITIICVGVFVAPICLYRHFGHLAILSVFSIATIWAVLGLVLIGGPLKQVHGEPMKVFDGQGVLASFGSMIFALSIASANFQAFVSTERSARNSSQWKQVTGLAVLAGTAMCVSMGVAGYSSFRADTDGVILDNFEGSEFDVFKLMVALHLIFYIPINFVIMRYSLVKMAMNKMSETLPEGQHTLISLGLLVVTVFFVLLLRYVGLASGDAFALTLNVTGGIGGSLVNFIIPSLIYIKLMPSGTWMFTAASIIRYLGVVIMFIVVTMTIWNVVKK